MSKLIDTLNYLTGQEKNARLVARPEAMRFQGSPIDYDPSFGAVMAPEQAQEYGMPAGSMVGYDPSGQAAQLKMPYSKMRVDPTAALGTVGAAGLGALAGYGLGKGRGAALGGLAGGLAGAAALRPVDIERGYQQIDIPSMKATLALRAAQAAEAERAMRSAFGTVSSEEDLYEQQLAKMSSDNTLFAECVALGIEVGREKVAADGQSSSFLGQAAGGRGFVGALKDRFMPGLKRKAGDVTVGQAAGAMNPLTGSLPGAMGRNVADKWQGTMRGLRQGAGGLKDRIAGTTFREIGQGGRQVGRALGSDVRNMSRTAGRFAAQGGAGGLIAKPLGQRMRGAAQNQIGNVGAGIRQQAQGGLLGRLGRGIKSRLGGGGAQSGAGAAGSTSLSPAEWTNRLNQQQVRGLAGGAVGRSVMNPDGKWRDALGR